MNDKEAIKKIMSMKIEDRFSMLSQMSEINDPKIILLLTEEWEFQAKIQQILVARLRAKAFAARGKTLLVDNELTKIVNLADATYGEWDGSGHGIIVVENRVSRELNAKEIHVPSKYFALSANEKNLIDNIGADRNVLRKQNMSTGSLLIVKTDNDIQGQSLTWSQDRAGLFNYFPMNLNYVKSAEILKKGSKTEIVQSAIRAVVRNSALPKVRLDGKQDSVVTLGSCFASEIHGALVRYGVNSQTLRLEETINTAHANKLLLASIETGEVAHSLKSVLDDPDVGRRLIELRDILKNAKIVVLTLGVSAQVVDVASGIPVYDVSLKELFISGRVEMRFSSVDENFNEIKEICSKLNQLAPSASIFVTLSPVPLIGVPSQYSVLERDVVSKSTIRLAIDRAQQELGVNYWPSFEVVKWLAPHLEPDIGFQAFGDPDNNSRHVSRWLIDEITKAFVEHCIELS